MLSSILPQNHLGEERNKGRFLVFKNYFREKQCYDETVLS